MKVYLVRWPGTNVQSVGERLALFTLVITKTDSPAELFALLDQEASPFEAGILPLAALPEALGVDLNVTLEGEEEGRITADAPYENVATLLNQYAHEEESSFTSGKIFFKDVAPYGKPE